MPMVMTRAGVKSVLRRPPVVIAILSLTALLASLAVTHLVNRYREQEKALARHLYSQGLAEMDSGKAELSIGYFRAALGYDRNNFEYQLSLARALRDTGRTSEARSYLMDLWEHAPEDGAVNLALGRLAVREGAISEAIHYYHNAVYGVWVADADAHRRNAQLELIDFLLRRNARPEAEAELITLAASLPRDSDIEGRVAQMFAQAGDYDRALTEYQTILQHDRVNAVAQAGAGEAAFQLHRYATAEKYLAAAGKLDARNPQADQSLQIAKLIIEIDPFMRRLSSEERAQRVQLAYERAAERLRQCSSQHDDGEPSSEPEDNADKSDRKIQNQEPAPISPVTPTSPPDLAFLQQRWLALKTGAGRRSKASAQPDSVEAIMDLVFQVEQQTQKSCPESTPLDQALLLLSQDREGADR